MSLFSFEIIEVILRRFLCKESKRYTVFFIRILFIKITRLKIVKKLRISSESWQGSNI